MMMYMILWIIIYFLNYHEAKQIHIPLCAAWNSNGTVVAGSENGVSGDNETMLNQPTAVTVLGENDTMYVVDSRNNRLMKYENGSRVGEQVNITTNTSNGSLYNPQDVVFDRSDAIYISEAGKDRVVKWILDPPESKIVANVTSPTGMYINDITEHLYVVENRPYPQVIRYDLNTSEGETVAGNDSRPSIRQTLSNLYTPVGIYVDRKKNLYVAESGSHQISKWGPKSTIGERVAGMGVGAVTPSLSYFHTPTAVILDDQDNMYITDSWNHRIVRKMNETGADECLIGCPEPWENVTISPLSRPYDAAFDSKLNLLVVERYYHRVKKFDFYFRLSCMIENCQPPIISIQNDSATILRSQPITFFIKAEINCHIWNKTAQNYTVSARFPGDKPSTQTTELSMIDNSFLTPNSYDMTIPSFGLPVGKYDFSCMIIMTSTGLNSSIKATLQVVRSPITITLLPLGKSKMTLGYQQQYTFRPNVSLDNSSIEDMRFVYYCRKYPGFNYSMNNGIRLNIDDDSNNPTGSSCFNLKAFPQSFVYDDNTNRTSLTIMDQSLQINQTYEFYVELYNGQDLIDKSDSVLVQIQLKNSIFVQISNIFDTLTLDNDYQLHNPSTQLVLQSSSDSSIKSSIQWKIYQGVMLSNSIIQWKEYSMTTRYLNEWIFGIESSLLTLTKEFFETTNTINYWQFECNYTDNDMYGSGSVQLKINHPPSKGRGCSISPPNGHTSRLYTITCQNWDDSDGIKDYFLHVETLPKNIQMSIAHSVQPKFNVYLPSGDPKLNHRLRLIVHVRDNLGAWAESGVMTPTIKPDEGIAKELSNFDENSNNLMKNLLLNGDQNQLINSFSVILNQQSLYDQESLMNNSQVQISKLIISTFDTSRAESSLANESNASSMFIESLRHRSQVREYLLTLYENYTLPTTIEEIIILSSTINQLTNTTSEWTRTSLSNASNMCNQLAVAFYNLSRKITLEEVTLVANSIAQCTSNVFTGVNAPLQDRGFIFEHHNRSETINFENETDIEATECEDSRMKDDQICREILIYDDDNSTMEFLHKNRLYYFQQRLADDLRHKIENTISLLGKSIRRHLNIHQEFPISYPALRMLVEQIYEKDIHEKLIDRLTRNASIYIPKSLDYHRSPKLGVQTTLLPLAPAGGLTELVRLSTVLTLSVLGDEDNELKINTTNDELIEMFIPRDVNLPIPPFIEQNISTFVPPKRGTFKVNRQFFIYLINIKPLNPNITISMHFELKPVDPKISYMIIYKFNTVPAYNSTAVSIDGSEMFCSENLFGDRDYHNFYINNTQTAGHKSVLVGLRELNDQELCSTESLPQFTDRPYSFSSNFSVRIYSSGCYYLDGKGRWKSDGMTVGWKTNFEYTHCYSNHT